MLCATRVPDHCILLDRNRLRIVERLMSQRWTSRWWCSMSSSISSLVLALAALAQFEVPQGLQPNPQNIQSTQAPASVPAPQPAETDAGGKRNLDSNVKVSGQQPWTDTGIDLLAGDHVTISGTGKLNYMENSAVGPQGIARSWKDTLRALPVNEAGRGALIARIGDDPNVVPFLVGD